MSTAPTPPYAGLTPDCVLDALESVGIRGDGRLLALNSYENRVYQVWLEEERAAADAPAASAGIVVAKFYRPARWSDAQILEEHAFVRELAESEIPVVAPLALRGEKTLHTFGDFRFSVYPKQGGRAPELEDKNTLEWIGRFIGRIHAVGARAAFVHRPAFDIAGFGEEPRDYLLSNAFIPPDLVDAWQSVVAQALDDVRRNYERAGEIATLRLHGDCHAGNVLWSDAPLTPALSPEERVRIGRGEVDTSPRRGYGLHGPHFVDFDDCRMGPAVQDLWMLLSGNRDLMQRQLGDVLAGYEDFCEFNSRELHLVEALRTLRLIHYSAWLARRWDDPAFPAAFPWFNTQRYWQDRVLELREQIALMQEAPISRPGR